MSDTNHLLVPYAALQSAGGQPAPAAPALPQLDRLLARLQPLASASDAGDEDNPALPHERALARALGLPGAGGHIAWAAWQVRQHGAPDLPGGSATATAAPTSAPSATAAAWAFVTPCHWQVRTDHVTLEDPAALALDEADSRALLAIVAPWFADDGITLIYEQPTRWLARGAVFEGLCTASLDRVLHRDVRAWLPSGAHAAGLRRLHSEVQMLLYTHPLSDAREARGLPAMNAFWVHGAGALAQQPVPVGPTPTVDASLRAAALRGDRDAWARAWVQLDAGPIAALAAQAARGQAVQLTLCGERSALAWHNGAPRSLRQRISSVFTPQRFASMREQL